jgi:hypothetical protein
LQGRTVALSNVRGVSLVAIAYSYLSCRQNNKLVKST